VREGEEARDERPFTLTEEDLVGLTPGAAPAPRFLGYFSRHAVEVLLERSGILALLRSKGFRALRVELDIRNGAAHTLRVVCDEGPEELLLELRAGRSRSAVPDMEVIFVEWLLLQNPRAEFSARRPQLTGQQHPGLGLLRDIMSWLVVVCERHGLDGIYFITSHYHLAAQSRSLMRLLRAEDEGRVRTFEEALKGLPLPEATAAVTGGRVIDGTTGEAAEWTPVQAVIPVSHELEALVTGADYEEKAAREATRLDLRLRPPAKAPGN
jgi:hypothetical protein